MGCVSNFLFNLYFLYCVIKYIELLEIVGVFCNVKERLGDKNEFKEIKSLKIYLK